MEPNEKKKKRNARRSWRNEVDEAMENRGLEDGEWEDRERWKIWLKEGRQRQL